MENRENVEGRREGESPVDAGDQAAAIAQPPKKSLRSKISQKGLENISSFKAPPELLQPSAPPPKPTPQQRMPYHFPPGSIYSPFSPSWNDPRYLDANGQQANAQRLQMEFFHLAYQQMQRDQSFNAAHAAPRPHRSNPPPDARPGGMHASYQKKRMEEPEGAQKEKSHAGIELLEKISDYPTRDKSDTPAAQSATATLSLGWDRPEGLPSAAKPESEAVMRENAFKKRSQSGEYEYIGDAPAPSVEVPPQQEPTPVLQPAPSVVEQSPAPITEPPADVPSLGSPEREEESSEEDTPAVVEIEERYQKILDYICHFKKVPTAEMYKLVRNFINPHAQKVGIGHNSMELALGRSTKHVPQRRVPEMPGVQRMRVSEEVLRQMKYIKEHADHWLVSKNEDDEEAKLYRILKHTLNKLSPDNFDAVSQELLDRCDAEKTVDMLIDCLVRKAWNEPVYTRWYAELAKLMVRRPMAWAVSERDKKGSKAVKEKLLVQLEMKYTSGFEEYHKKAEEIAGDASLAPEDRQERLNKMRKSLLGNMNFISELYRCRVMASKALRWVVFFGISRFLEQFLQPNLGFSVKEDYLEALLNLFENTGELFESRARELSVVPADDEIIDQLNRMLTDEPELAEDFFEFADSRENQVASILDIFFSFLDAVKNCRFRSISMRMESLIDNLIDFRNSGWRIKVGRIEAAKRLQDVHGRRPPQASHRPTERPGVPPPAVHKWEQEEQHMDEEEFRTKLLHFTQMFEKQQNEEENAKEYQALLRSVSNPLPVLLVTWAENVRNVSAMAPRFQTLVALFTEGVLKAEALYSVLPAVYLKLAELGSEQPKKFEALSELFFRLRAKGLIDLRRLGLQRHRSDITDEDLQHEFSYLMKRLFEEVTKACQQISGDPKLLQELAELKERFRP